MVLTVDKPIAAQAVRQLPKLRTATKGKANEWCRCYCKCGCRRR
jgi:hypothetical protein